jgi:hypothetical protein
MQLEVLLKYTHELQRYSLIGVIAGLTALGCAQSEAPPDPGSGTGGTEDVGSVPPPGAGGSEPLAGAAGSTTGVAGAAGSESSAAGRAGLAGNPDATGTAGSLGRGGTSGAPDGGAPGSATDAGAAPTFTQVYTTILSVYCAGSSCHAPGTKAGVNFASQSTAYSTLKSKVVPGNGAGSSLYTVVNTGKMPEGKPKLSAANIALIKAWIDTGALNN